MAYCIYLTNSHIRFASTYWFGWILAWSWPYHLTLCQSWWSQQFLRNLTARNVCMEPAPMKARWVDWRPVVETQCEIVLVHLVFEFTSIVVFLSNKLFKRRCGWLLHGHVVASVEDRKVGNLLDQCFLFAEKLLSWSALVHHRWWASWWQFGFFAPGGKGSSFDGGSGWFVAVRGGSWSKR